MVVIGWLIGHQSVYYYVQLHAGQAHGKVFGWVCCFLCPYEEDTKVAAVNAR